MNVFDVVGNITGIVAFVISAINFGYFFIIRRKKLTVCRLVSSAGVSEILCDTLLEEKEKYQSDR